jgi:hypothetical protein
MTYNGQSSHTELEEQLVCANCGKKAGRYYEELLLPEGETYKGNSRVVSNSGERYGQIVWRLNRGTYRAFNYGQFCTTRCAVAFANAAVRHLKRISS